MVFVFFGMFVCHPPWSSLWEPCLLYTPLHISLLFIRVSGTSSWKPPTLDSADSTLHVPSSPHHSAWLYLDCPRKWQLLVFNEFSGLNFLLDYLIWFVFSLTAWSYHFPTYSLTGCWCFLIYVAQWLSCLSHHLSLAQCNGCNQLFTMIRREDRLYIKMISKVTLSNLGHSDPGFSHQFWQEVEVNIVTAPR